MPKNKKQTTVKDKFKATKPLYNVSKSWEDNYKSGPNFKGPYPSFPKEAKWKFLGHSVVSPIGVAAGPLPNSKWMIPFLKLGYGSVTQKTVRSSAHKSHPAPNITFVENGQSLVPLSKPLVVGNKINNPIEKLSITNSFGNPSLPVKVWQQEARKEQKVKTKF